MAFFECLHMAMHLMKLLQNGQNLQMNLVMLGFHWKLVVLIHLESFGLFTKCELFFVGPGLWKEVKNEEEKGKSELRGRHSDCHWVEASKRTEKMERSAEKKAVG
jgi:hypothetical protein